MQWAEGVLLGLGPSGFGKRHMLVPTLHLCPLVGFDIATLQLPTKCLSNSLIPKGLDLEFLGRWHHREISGVAPYFFI